MDFTRTSEATYFQSMQLGDSTMDASSTSTGAAVSLVWGSFNSAHNQFGYINSAGNFINVLGGTTQLTGAHTIKVTVSIGDGTYAVEVDSVVKAINVNFRDNSVTSLAEMRFFQDLMDGTASGRTFDNISLTTTPLNECVPPSCDDGIQNQGEDGIDCGDDVCSACPTILVSDDFDRANSSTIGGVWSETTASGANADIVSNKLRLNSSNNSMRPIVETSFTEQTCGELVWTFDMDFTRTSETEYRQFMQLGASNMGSASLSTGVGVSLIWTEASSTHNLFGYVNSLGNFQPLVTLTGTHTITVIVDLAATNYVIKVDGVAEGTGSFRDSSVTSLSEMRFLQDLMDTSATGRTIDNVLLTTDTFLCDGFNRTNSSTLGGSWTETAPGTPDAVISSNQLRMDGADGSNFNPLVESSFTTRGTGLLTWKFWMSFTRSSDTSYKQVMQLGDGMSGSSTTGVAVDLSWGNQGGNHNQFGYTDSSGTFVNVMGGTTGLTGGQSVEVTVDLEAQSYDIKVGATTRATDIDFRDGSVTELSEVRYYSDGLSATTITGRLFDDISVSSP
jgi:hypothetical protein